MWLQQKINEKEINTRKNINIFQKVESEKSLS